MACAWLLGLFGLAETSEYSPFPPAGGYTDLRVASMLTPVGMVKNLWLHDVPAGQPDLTPWYDKPANRVGVLEHPWILALVAWVAGAAIAFLRLWRPFS